MSGLDIEVVWSTPVTEEERVAALMQVSNDDPGEKVQLPNGQWIGRSQALKIITQVTEETLKKTGQMLAR